MSDTVTHQRPPEGVGRCRRYGRVEDGTLVPFLTAVLVLATAVVGLYAQRTTSERNRLQDDSSSLGAQVQPLSDSNGKLLAANEELEAANAKLRQQLEATTPTTSGGTAPRSAEIFRQTGASPVVVRERFGIDLDSQASN